MADYTGPLPSGPSFFQFVQSDKIPKSKIIAFNHHNQSVEVNNLAPVEVEKQDQGLCLPVSAFPIQCNEEGIFRTVHQMRFFSTVSTRLMPGGHSNDEDISAKLREKFQKAPELIWVAGEFCSKEDVLEMSIETYNTHHIHMPKERPTLIDLFRAMYETNHYFFISFILYLLENSLFYKHSSLSPQHVALRQWTDKLADIPKDEFPEPPSEKVPSSLEDLYLTLYCLICEYEVERFLRDCVRLVYSFREMFHRTVRDTGLKEIAMSLYREYIVQQKSYNERNLQAAQDETPLF